MTWTDFQEQHFKVPVCELSNDICENPLVSVCVQTYQHHNFIRDCLDGLLMQKTDFAFEILLGEDDSTDGTREICRDYAEKYSDRIRLFLHDRVNNISIQGRPTGRFSGLCNIFNSRGKYIAFCEGDDMWTDPYKLKRQIDFLEQNSNYSGVGCYSDRLELQDNRVTTYRAKQPLKEIIYQYQDTYRKSIRGSKTCTMVYRRDGALVDYPSWALDLLSGDRVVAYSMLKDIGKICVLPFVGAVYRVHSGGVWSSLHKHQVRANLQVNYETISRHIFDDFHEKVLFFWLHFRKTVKHDIGSLNIKYVYRSLLTVFNRA
ncbi:MAG: glycosyltransferase [Saprospiraceae bacterium]|nr:glycosyltransferase [Saprospiraceae bacterium]